MSSLTRFVMAGVILAVTVCSACTWWKVAPTPVKRDTIAGQYVLRMEDSGAPHRDPDRLTLKADGRYTLVHMPGGHPGSTEEGTWELLNKFEPSVAFGKTAYPIEVRGKRIRLVVNDDLGYYYEKIG